MEREPMTEQGAMIQPLTVEDFNRNPKIQRARKNLLIVISIQLGIWIICGLIVIAVVLKNAASNPYYTQSWTAFNLYSIKIVLIIITAYIIFIIVVIEHSRLGLLIFICLTLARLITSIIETIFKFIQESYHLYRAEYRRPHTIVVVIIIIVLSVEIVLLVLTIAFALILAKLIKRPTTNQIV